MQTTLWLLSLPFGFLFLKLIYGIIYGSFLSPLKEYPGSFWWKISDIPLTLSRIRGTHHHDVLVMHEKHGPVIRIAPNRLSYTTAEPWKDVWTSRAGHEEFRKDFLVLDPDETPGILTAPSKKTHARYRRMFAHAFSAQGLREQENHINHYADLFISGVAEHGKKAPVNLTEWFNWFSFDLIGDLAFGESFGCLEKGQTHDWIAGILGNIHSVALIESLMKIGLGILIPLVVPRRLLELRQKNFEYSADKVNRRLQYGTDRGDFFDKILKHGIVDDEKGYEHMESGLTRKEMESNASAIVLGGSETTSTLLSGTIYLLLRNPHVMSRLLKEVRSTFSSEKEITIDSVNNLTYLIAVLSESMRIYPPVPTAAPRLVPYPGDTVAGKYLPGGTAVNIVHYAAYRYSKNFRRPLEFLPERWLKEGMEGEFATDNREVFQPFSVGSRNCIGKQLAYADQRLIMSKFLWRFDLSFPEGTEGIEKWMDQQKAFILWAKAPLMVNVKERQDLPQA